MTDGSWRRGDEAAPLVSVVIATNRARPYLGEAVASVAAQTWRAIELIVVDDGSDDPDEVSRVAADVAGAVVVRQCPSGASAARNRGAALAHGEYLVFLDDDDVWAPERVVRHVEALELRPDAVASYCGMRAVRAETREVLLAADQEPVSDRYDVARRKTGIILPNLFFVRSAFDAVGGFDPRLHFAEDLDLVLRLNERGSFAFVDEALVDYRVTEHNATRRHRELVEGIRAVLESHRVAADERGDVELVAALEHSMGKNDRFAWWGAGRIARDALAAGHPGAAMSELLWAWRTAPRGLVHGVRRRLSRRG